MKDKKISNLFPRPPIVVVVGHVDHGKTSLLDYIRKTNAVAKEAGGITQSTGAYEIEHSASGEPGARKRITFIDTPGHLAFSKMRERGSKIADIAILVVAAEESLKPQSVEVLNMLRDSDTPFIVAITKIDKPNANVEKVKNDLLATGIALEGYGGNVSWQAISSKTGEGINELLNLILLMGEVLDLKFDPLAPVSGFVLESLKDTRKGVVAHLILKDGTLKEGDEIKTSSASGKVKVLENFLGDRVKELTPSAPASVFGFESIPLVGEEFYVGDMSIPEVVVKENVKVIEKASEEGKVNAILKADNSGSLEVLGQVVEHLVVVKGASIGEITDGDVNSAISSQSIIVGFRVKVNKAAQSFAKIQRVALFNSDVIYKLVEEIEGYIKEKTGPVFTGELEVLRVFGEDGKRQIIGGKVIYGAIKNGSEIKIERNLNMLGDGRILNVQEQKKDVSEIKEGMEGGMLIESETKIRVGDKVKTL